MQSNAMYLCLIVKVPESRCRDVRTIQASQGLFVHKRTIPPNADGKVETARDTDCLFQVADGQFLEGTMQT